MTTNGGPEGAAVFRCGRTSNPIPPLATVALNGDGCPAGNGMAAAVLVVGAPEGETSMKSILILSGIAACSVVLTGCATTRDYASQCQRDYAENRQYATASGAALGAIAGAAIAGERDRERGAAIGALAGGLLGNQLSAQEDPCGYGFGGYNRDGRYGYERISRRGDYGRYY